MEIDEYRGSLISAGVSLRYRATDKLKLGGGYAYFDLAVSMERQLWNEEAPFAYHGPGVFFLRAVG